MKNSKSIFVLLIIIFLSGCAAIVPMAPEEQNIKAKSFTTLPDKASVYIFRDEIFGMEASLLVSVNGKMLGATSAMSFFHLDLPPGEYSINSFSPESSSTVEHTAKSNLWYPSE